MSKEVDYDAVRKDIAACMEQPGYDDGSAGPVFVRLAWHSAGTYCKDTKTGGSNGAGMRYEKEGGDPANAGLQHARVFLEPVKAKHENLSYADLWTLAGVVAIEEMGGPKIEWKAGRTDFTDDSKVPPRGRLPDGAQAEDHLRAVFGRMGFTDDEIITLSGAHNLGRCHADRSGFEGPWVMRPTVFSNQYYKMLKNMEWKPKEWSGPKQYANDDLGQELMMLETDLALLKMNKDLVHKYADDKDAFFDDFAKVFAKLIELGVDRKDAGYEAAPKKSNDAGAPGQEGNDGQASIVKHDDVKKTRSSKL
ncbi:uncharacterized protein L969DRAFT_60670 [Mixia osmundae IAM 14324]|uniref:Peroxidase n=1 Tax=Mixia osmundae (strain CBS 9802 / IAM 14324 / JCM 22182 / KY 12970) TaxID=764103 RepID=G7E9I8_MIXOS|nr:uncharacterized protein L969DRAFT_60670 [Mixia osmundae IAM 14324]KEI39939.1 hypothetical protein L969DRAFT_60670 [Mixia osmundae IAM 14324]GAA99307.1 hypothetical protein E5Q_06002 [Mixia osmundae IAM 14324]